MLHKDAQSEQKCTTEAVLNKHELEPLQSDSTALKVREPINRRFSVAPMMDWTEKPYKTRLLGFLCSLRVQSLIL